MDTLKETYSVNGHSKVSHLVNVQVKLPPPDVESSCFAAAPTDTTPVGSRRQIWPIRAVLQPVYHQSR